MIFRISYILNIFFFHIIYAEGGVKTLFSLLSHIINIQGDSYRLKEKKQTVVLNSEIYKFEAKSSNLDGQNQEVV